MGKQNYKTRAQNKNIDHEHFLKEENAINLSKQWHEENLGKNRKYDGKKYWMGGETEKHGKNTDGKNMDKKNTEYKNRDYKNRDDQNKDRNNMDRKNKDRNNNTTDKNYPTSSKNPYNDNKTKTYK